MRAFYYDSELRNLIQTFTYILAHTSSHHLANTILGRHTSALHTVLAETTMSFVFVAKTIALAINATKNDSMSGSFGFSAAMFVSLTDLVVKQAVKKLN